MGTLLIYGAYGYTGELVASLETEAGRGPILAGRNREKLEALGKQLGAPTRACGLEDPRALDEALDGVDVVLNCAGPFSQTAAPMMAACLRSKVHYLDITGEIDVFEHAASLDAKARDANIMLMPGVGFDVVPSDCLAVHLKQKLPSATHLRLAFKGSAAPSHGSAMTSLEGLGRPGKVRRNGKIIDAPVASIVETIELGGKPRTCASLPWGDVSTAFYSTNIPNIEVLMAVSPSMLRMMKLNRWLGPVLRAGPVRRWMAARVPPGGPDADARRGRSSYLRGRVRDPSGRTAEASLETPNGYTLTGQTAQWIAHAALHGETSPGFQTPAMVYGPDLILKFDGVTRTDE